MKIQGYWKQERWNRYALTAPGFPTTYFTDYAGLYRYCQRRGIDARQV